LKKLICGLLILSGLVYAESSIEIHGTSTLHDWAMVSKTMNVAFESDDSKITKLDVGVQIKTLKSGDEGLDEKAYDTLKIDRNNVITFSLKEYNANGTIKGVFKVLDKEREETLTPDILTLDHVAGSFKVKMTDFNLEIPSVMFGAIKSGDEVTVKYDITK
jgi:polyisoprenoid-binding protein YceI